MSWISGLSFADLQRLREITRKVHFQHVPGVIFDEKEADRLIEALGPEISERLVRKFVDGGQKP
jgi:hypothetical protein